jgi:hypothetical protein
LHESNVIKLRDIPVAIDICIPKKVKIKRKGEYIKFFGDVPFGRMSHYGI